MGKKLSHQQSLKISKHGSSKKKQLNIKSNTLIKVLKPKVYITHISSFKQLVQQLTGYNPTTQNSSSSSTCSATLESEELQQQTTLTVHHSFSSKFPSSPQFSPFSEVESWLLENESFARNLQSEQEEKETNLDEEILPTRTKLTLTRWSADWRSAAGLFEQAVRLAKEYEKAKLAFEKASKVQEMLSSLWDAAKHMESAGAVAKELGNWNEVADFYRRAFNLYIECGRSQPASDVLAKGARQIESLFTPASISKTVSTSGSVLKSVSIHTNVRIYDSNRLHQVYLIKPIVPNLMHIPSTKTQKNDSDLPIAIRKGPFSKEQIDQLLKLLKSNMSIGTPNVSFEILTCHDVCLTEKSTVQQLRNFYSLCNIALEETVPDEAVQLYTEACSLLEEDGKEQMAFDLYHAAATIYIKLENFVRGDLLLVEEEYCGGRGRVFGNHSLCLFEEKDPCIVGGDFSMVLFIHGKILETEDMANLRKILETEDMANLRNLGELILVEIGLVLHFWGLGLAIC
ncbi:hypothetical protein RJ641_017659 [Dillenia turbinata]|uniref:Gamma-soluble NSF attachment protein n=1 Tax=Dillenia turbinata TaxID=194707 RepID=A0AAN8Z143_9MAGN